MTDTLIKTIVHTVGVLGDRRHDEGNIWQAVELEFRGPDDYWIRNHVAQDGVENDRTARRGWARWTPSEGHLEERKHFAYYIMRNAHPDEFAHLVGPGRVRMDLDSIHTGRGVELGAIRNRAEVSPMIQGRITKAVILNAAPSVNHGLTPDEIAEKIREGR